MVSQEFKRQSRSVLLEQIRQILEGREGLPLEVMRAVNEDTDSILNQLGNPKHKEERFSIFGMVVGLI